MFSFVVSRCQTGLICAMAGSCFACIIECNSVMLEHRDVEAYEGNQPAWCSHAPFLELAMSVRTRRKKHSLYSLLVDKICEAGARVSLRVVKQILARIQGEYHQTSPHKATELALKQAGSLLDHAQGIPCNPPDLH
eukprot:scaffold43060_cov18-Tisochrysis_lutea.AAC.1